MSLEGFLKNSIKFYHNYLSSFMLCKCRHYPSCSEYTLEAIDDRGAFLGILKGLARILRCNPFFPGGYDPYNTELRAKSIWQREKQTLCP